MIGWEWIRKLMGKRPLKSQGLAGAPKRNQWQSWYDSNEVVRNTTSEEKKERLRRIYGGATEAPANNLQPTVVSNNYYRPEYDEDLLRPPQPNSFLEEPFSWTQEPSPVIETPQFVPGGGDAGGGGATDDWGGAGNVTPAYEPSPAPSYDPAPSCDTSSSYDSGSSSYDSGSSCDSSSSSSGCE